MKRSLLALLLLLWLLPAMATDDVSTVVNNANSGDNAPVALNAESSESPVAKTKIRKKKNHLSSPNLSSADMALHPTRPLSRKETTATPSTSGL